MQASAEENDQLQAKETRLMKQDNQLSGDNHFSVSF